MWGVNNGLSTQLAETPVLKMGSCMKQINFNHTPSRENFLTLFNLKKGNVFN